MQKIAIPVNDNILTAHFGHASAYVVFDVYDNTIVGEKQLIPPPHAPGILPRWLAGHDVTDVIAGGMGQRAINLFNENKINVYAGAELKDARILAQELLDGRLVAGQNLCDH